MTEVKKSGVISSLFENKIFPIYAHAITGEKFPYDDRWNKLSYNNMWSRKSAVDKANTGNELTSEEKELLLITGLFDIKSNQFFEDNFKVI